MVLYDDVLESVDYGTLSSTQKSTTISRSVSHSLATTLSTSSTPSRARFASLNTTSHSNKYQPPPLMCRHASIEFISTSTSSIANHQSRTEKLPILYFLASFLFSRMCLPAAIELGELTRAEYRETGDDIGLASVLSKQQSRLSKAIYLKHAHFSKKSSTLEWIHKESLTQMC